MIALRLAEIASGLRWPVHETAQFGGA